MSIARRIQAWKSKWSNPRPPIQPARLHRTKRRRATVEQMEHRLLFDADPIWLGGVYVESDIGHDDHGDLFYVSFKGGAAGTQLTKLTILTDQNATGLSVGDNIFDTLSSGLGADHAHGFQISKLQAANPNARVQARVDDASMSLVLTFENFQAGDLLVFSIDVDEIQHFDPSETNLELINGGLDPITSGVEFQGSKLIGEFSAPHYESTSGTGTFVNAYNTIVDPAKLSIPRDDDDGLRDRTAGTALQLKQVPKPISLAGTVYYDNDMDLTQDPQDVGLSGVRLELWKKEGSGYVNTGHRTTTDAQGNYKFGVELKLTPGTYQVRETQPEGYLSVGAVPGSIAGVGTVGQIVAGDKDVLTEITIEKGDQHAVDLDFAEVEPVSISGHVCLALPDSIVSRRRRTAWLPFLASPSTSWMLPAIRSPLPQQLPTDRIVSIRSPQVSIPSLNIRLHSTSTVRQRQGRSPEQRSVRSMIPIASARSSSLLASMPSTMTSVSFCPLRSLGMSMKTRTTMASEHRRNPCSSGSSFACWMIKGIR